MHGLQTPAKGRRQPHTGDTILSTHTHTSRDHAIAHVWHVQRVLPLFQAVLGARDALFDILDLAGGERLTLPRTLEGRHRLWQGRARRGNASLAWQPHDCWRARLGGSVEGWGIGHAAFARAAPARCVPAAVSSSSALDPRANVPSSSTGQRRRLAARQLAQGWACCPPCTPRRGCTARSHPACASLGPALPVAPRPRCLQRRATGRRPSSKRQSRPSIRRPCSVRSPRP